jgi:hypothetical protein
MHSKAKANVKQLCILALVGATAVAAPIDPSKLPPPATQKGVTYEKDIHPILQASCLRCHGPERPKGGLRLDTLEGVLKGSKDGKVLTPGQSEKSLLVIAVSQLDPHSAMPPKPRQGRPSQPGPGGPGSPPAAGNNGPASPDAPGGAPPAPGGPGRPKGPPPKPLTSEQVGLVRAWIDQGAN